MNTKQISDTLNWVFAEKNKRINFWYNGERGPLSGMPITSEVYKLKAL